MTEPERIPIDPPGKRWRSIDADYSSIHRANDGTWYKIRNTSSVEADNRLHSERLRNEGLRLKDLLDGV